jgi:SAM-dependent methyltransferase
MPPSREELDRQLRRQAAWLSEHWIWLLRTKVIEERRLFGRKPTALDVGCGPGHVMNLLSAELDIRGLDCDPLMVAECKRRGLEAVEGYAEELPFEDDAFDLVYCSFLLIWVKEPARVLKEMRRVSRKLVFCMAEPDYGARIAYPNQLNELTDRIVEGLRGEGADPFLGRKLEGMFSNAGMRASVGVHPGVMTLEQLREETEGEWDWIRTTVPADTSPDELSAARAAWDEALKDGSLFLFSPIFYAYSEVEK